MISLKTGVGNVNEWSIFENVSYMRCTKLQCMLSEKKKESKISKSASQSTSTGFTVTLELVCKTLHINHVSIFTIPITRNCMYNTLKKNLLFPLKQTLLWLRKVSTLFVTHKKQKQRLCLSSLPTP